LLNDILTGAYRIDVGRKGFAVPGAERAGRLSYEDGIALAMAAFHEAQRGGDPQTIILAEVYFLTQELQFCPKGDTNTINSLTYAIQSFRDALRSFQVVEDVASYNITEKTYPTDPKKRVQGFPADAFHQACDSHKMRLCNSLRAPGVDMLGKFLLEQRAASMKAAQGSYVENRERRFPSNRQKTDELYYLYLTDGTL
jgi:hypothetical protein